MADRGHHPAAVRYEPAADAERRYPEWTVADADLGGLLPEVLCWDRRVILIDATQGPAARRSSLAHAVAHLDLEHRWTLAGYFENREEAAADSLAAQRLIPFGALRDAVAWSRDRDEVAASLGVDTAMLDAREQSLSRDERRRLRRVSRSAD